MPYKDIEKRREVVRNSVNKYNAKNKDKIKAYKAHFYACKCEIRDLMNILHNDEKNG